MEKELQRFTYKGPVMKFDTCVATNWTDTTYAVSEAKARSNFAYRYKMMNNLVPSAKITMPGKIEAVK